MSILSLVMVVVIGAMVQLYATANRVDATSIARDQLSNSFRRLDKELRYAIWVSTPGQVRGVWYFEYALPAGCRQLSYNDGVLALAAWTPPNTTPGKPTTVATGLSLTSSTIPFTVYAANVHPFSSASTGTAGMGRQFSPEHAQVRIQFVANQGRVSLPYDVVFTAQNNTPDTPSLNDCGKGRPT